MLGDAGLAREQDGGEEVVGAAAHRDDVRLDRLAARSARARRGSPRTTAKVRRPASSSGGGRKASGRREASSRDSSCAARVARAPRSRSSQPVDQLRERVVVGVRVLAHVERREVQPERGERAHGALEPAVRDQLAAVRDERVAHQPQLGEQLARADVVAARLARPPAREPRARVHELLLDAGELQPVGLLGVQAQEARLHLRQQLEVARERLAAAPASRRRCAPSSTGRGAARRPPRSRRAGRARAGGRARARRCPARRSGCRRGRRRSSCRRRAGAPPDRQSSPSRRSSSASCSSTCGTASA